jgi:hypothetical protein
MCEHLDFDIVYATRVGMLLPATDDKTKQFQCVVCLENARNIVVFNHDDSATCKDVTAVVKMMHVIKYVRHAWQSYHARTKREVGMWFVHFAVNHTQMTGW